MKQLLFLLLFPCLALAQYQGNGNQKITLGEQTTADGLVFRGVANDTNIITPFSDTSAYIILDTVNSKFYHYNITTTYWILAGGGGGSTLDTAAMLLPYYRAGMNGIIQAANVPTLNQNTTGSAATLTTARNIRINLASAYGANFDGSADITPGVTGVLGAGNGGTGAINFGSPNRIPFVSSSGSLTTDTFFAYNGTTQRLGVGVPNPTEKLHVSGNGLFTGSVSLGTPLTVANGGTGQTTLAAAGINTGSGTLNYLPKYTSTGTTLGNSLIFDNGSSVGIGTTSPLAKLQVKSSGVTNSTTALKVDNSGDANLLTILDNGNVGVGVTNPIYKLEVESNIAGVSTLRLNNNNSGGALILTKGATSIMYNGSADSWVGSGTTNDAGLGAYSGGIRFFTGNSTATKMTISSAGLVGIGRTPTTNILEINGDASKSTAGQWLANSDLAIKTEINTIDGALDRINKIRLVSFKYKNEYKLLNSSIKDKFYQNVIAQEFQKIYPDYVYESGTIFEGKNILQVDTNPMFIDAVASIQQLSLLAQELQSQIDTLKQEIINLKNK